MKNVQSVEGEALSTPPPPRKKESQEKKSKGEVVKVSGPKGPAASMATGVKVWHWSRAKYFSCLLHSARVAMAPASLVHGIW